MSEQTKYSQNYFCQYIDVFNLPECFRRWSRKGSSFLKFVLECGNFGRNRKGDAVPARSYVGRKAQSLWRKVRDFGRHMRLFPWDSVRFFWHLFWDGVATAAQGE